MGRKHLSHVWHWVEARAATVSGWILSLPMLRQYQLQKEMQSFGENPYKDYLNLVNMVINNNTLFVAMGNSDKKNRVYYFLKSRITMFETQDLKYMGQLYKRAWRWRQTAINTQAPPNFETLKISRSICKSHHRAAYQVKVRKFERKNAESFVLIWWGKDAMVFPRSQMHQAWCHWQKESNTPTGYISVYNF